MPITVDYQIWVIVQECFVIQFIEVAVNFTELLNFTTVAVAPRNLQITPKQTVYQVGDRIQCSAQGNPAPSNQWKDLVSGDVTQGAVLVISEDMMNRNYTFQCTTTNNYGSISSNFSFTVEGMPITENCYIDYSSLEELISDYCLPV